jgi:hypothetical protein
MSQHPNVVPLLFNSDPHISDLSVRIIKVCSGCPHSKFVAGHFECDRKKSQCHSKRVRKWLAEIADLEGK